MLSTTSEYALRAMVHLARLPGTESMLTKDLAAVAQIPANYLSKVLLTLRTAGLLKAVRGTGGGYRLARPAAHIYLMEIVEQFEIVRRNPSCFLVPGNQCSEENACTAHRAIGDVQAAFLGVLVATSLAEIAGCPPERPSMVLPRGREQEESRES